MIKKSRLRWFGHVEQTDDNDCVKHCITFELERITQKKIHDGIVLGMTLKV